MYTKHKKLKIRLSSVLLVILVGMSGFAAAENTGLNSGDNWKTGAQIYAQICAYCHEGQVAPLIRNRDLPKDYIRSVVRHGNRAMPSFRLSEIDDASLLKLADYVSSKNSQFPAEGNAP